MKVKTSVTLSEELLKAIAIHVKSANRSALIEQAMWEYLNAHNRADRDRNEMAQINVASAELNREALDTIDYQIEK